LRENGISTKLVDSKLSLMGKYTKRKYKRKCRCVFYYYIF